MASIFRRYTPHYRSLLAMGVPIMVGQLGIILTGFVDNIMVGHHATEELSAASFVNNIFMLPLMFATGFAMGITPLIGEQTGRNELLRAGQTFRYGLYANAILAVILIGIMGTLYFFLDRLGLPAELLPLMRPYYLLHLVGLIPVLLFNAFKHFADGTTDTLTPMFILLASNLLNIIGNALLIYGYAGFPEWGLFGAGVSTLIARIFTIAAGWGIFLYRKRYRRFRSGFFRLPADRRLYRPILTMGIPVALQLGMETGSFSLSVIFIGWIGSTALAAHQAAVTFSTIGFLLYSGIGRRHHHRSEQRSRQQPRARNKAHRHSGCPHRTCSYSGRYFGHVLYPPVHRVHLYRLVRGGPARIGHHHSHDGVQLGDGMQISLARRTARTRCGEAHGVDSLCQLFRREPAGLIPLCLCVQRWSPGRVVGLPRRALLRSIALFPAIQVEQRTGFTGLVTKPLPHSLHDRLFLRHINRRRRA